MTSFVNNALALLTLCFYIAVILVAAERSHQHQQARTNPHNDVTTRLSKQPRRHHSLTDGVDRVTWSILVPAGQEGSTIDLGSKDVATTALTCNISRKQIGEDHDPPSEIHSDKDTVRLHKRLCKSHSRKKRAIIAPGTNWCGAGNVAGYRNDLGAFKRVDECCRDHDHCPLAIEGKSRKYGLYNKGSFTLSSCVCDDEFKRCLTSVGNYFSNLIGYIFFNILSSQCVDFSRANRGDTTSLSSDYPFIRDNPPFTMVFPKIMETIQRFLPG